MTLTPPAADGQFSDADEVRATDAVMTAARAAGLRLASAPAGFQGQHVYLEPLVRLLAGPDDEDPQVEVSAVIQRDKKKILATLRDFEHGGPTPFTRQLLEALRNELGNALPGSRVDTSKRRMPKFLEP